MIKFLEIDCLENDVASKELLLLIEYIKLDKYKQWIMFHHLLSIFCETILIKISSDIALHQVL